MQISKSKTATLIALFLMLTIAVTLVALPIANAHDPPWTIPTSAYVVCGPATVGVGQYTTIVVWVDRYSPTAGGIGGQRWNGFKLDITKPDGTKETIGPWQCSSTLASDYKTYIPDQVGTYTIVFSWPGDTVVASLGMVSTANIGDYFAGSTSEPFTLTVQQTPVPSWPEPPLPTGFWTRPINSQNRGWSTLASNWLKGSWLLPGGFQNEGTGPTSAHVLWTAPIMASSPSDRGYPGGIVDAQWPGIQNNINDYQDPWTNPIIMNGVLYYNAPNTQESARYGYYAVDLYTGKQIWYKNGTDNGLNNPFTVSGGPLYGQTYPSLTQGQLLFYHSVNGIGVHACLWMIQGSTWYMLDPSTGNYLLTLTNVPGGTAATDAMGNLLRYSYNSATGNLLCWNSTQSIPTASPTGTSQQQWRVPLGRVINAVADTSQQNASTTWGTTLDPLVQQALAAPRSGYTMNVTIPTGLPGTMTILQDDQREPRQIFGSAITTTTSGVTTSVSADTIRIWLATINEGATAYSPWPTLPATLNTNLGFTVTMNYQKTFTVPIPNKNHTWTIPVVNYASQVFFLHCQQTRQDWCYSLKTGELLWGPTIQLPPMGYFWGSSWGSGIQANVYYGIYLAMGSQNYAGVIYAYNATNGNLLWNYNNTATYPYESFYGANMPLMLDAVCDGKIYARSTEHSPTNPLWRNSYIYCINITDGTLIWKLAQFVANNYISATQPMGSAIADGYLVSASNYDNLIYTIGKGPSATTVSAPQSGITMGQSFTITGTVIDQSPGTIAYATKYGDVNGVACVSEASQEGWMEYLYMQQAIPTNATGVPVSIALIDPNGNYVNLGTATNNLNAVYGLKVDTNNLAAGPGLYEVIATFAGSNSYGSSSATSFFTVNEAPAAPIEGPQPEPYPPVDMYVLYATIAIIIAVAIATFLMLRKKP